MTSQQTKDQETQNNQYSTIKDATAPTDEAASGEDQEAIKHRREPGHA